MSTNKHIDRICIGITVLTLILTVFCMLDNSTIHSAGAQAENGMFAADDLSPADFVDATQITFNGNRATVKGNGAYATGGNVSIIYAGDYILSGNLTGTVTIDADGDDTVRILLKGANITAKTGAAFTVEQADKVILTLADGTENALIGGELDDETVDGVIFSRDDLTINGNGKLTVTGNGKHGIVCNDDLLITSGIFGITAKEDGIHANDSVRICKAEVTVRAGDDGVTVSNDDSSAFFYMESGALTVLECYEGIEAHTVTLAGGTVDITPTDDGINADGDGNALIEITGGDITINNPTGRDADGLDSNGNIRISGGNLFISVTGNGTNTAIDYGSENGGTCTIDGGRVLAFGSSSMFEGISADSTQGFISKTGNTFEADTEVSLSQNGKEIFGITVPNAFSAAVLSDPLVKIGETYTLSLGTTTEEITVNNAETDSLGGFGDRNFGAKRQQNHSLQWNGDNTPPDGFGNAPNGTPPQMPNGEIPQMPNGETPEEPNGQLPQKPSGKNPEKATDEPMTDESQNNGDDFSPDRKREFAKTDDNKKTESTSHEKKDLLPLIISVIVLAAGLTVAFFKKI